MANTSESASRQNNELEVPSLGKGDMEHIARKLTDALDTRLFMRSLHGMEKGLVENYKKGNEEVSTAELINHIPELLLEQIADITIDNNSFTEQADENVKSDKDFIRRCSGTADLIHRSLDVNESSDEERSLVKLKSLVQISMHEFFSDFMLPGESGEEREVLRYFAESCAHNINESLQILAEKSITSRSSEGSEEWEILSNESCEGAPTDNYVPLQDKQSEKCVAL